MHIEKFTIVCRTSGVNANKWSTCAAIGAVRQLSYNPATSASSGYTAKCKVTFCVSSSTGSIIYKTTLLNAKWLAVPMKKPVNSTGAAMNTSAIGNFVVLAQDRIMAKVVVPGTSVGIRTGTFNVWVEGVKA